MVYKKGTEWIGGRKTSPKKDRKSPSITRAIKKKLDQCPKGMDRKTYLELIVEIIFDKAVLEKDSKTLEMIWKYIDGLPKQNIGLDEETVEQLGVILYPKKDI